MSTPNRPAEGGDPLEELGERLRSAQETADRLVREATEAARTATMAGGAPEDDRRRPPPRGYATPGDAGARSTAADIQALAALVDLGRTVLPPELRAQFAELVRELLLLVRALIDWYLERVEARRKTPVEVQDIPIS
ncbi:MAG TPA: hypothetical protein VNB64_03085 [Solirubrobacteraceae bacterium]|nr:hypothetical protein [Solirubrobacteraceae bacterium]